MINWQKSYVQFARTSNLVADTVLPLSVMWNDPEYITPGVIVKIPLVHLKYTDIEKRVDFNGIVVDWPKSYVEFAITTGLVAGERIFLNVYYCDKTPVATPANNTPRRTVGPVRRRT